MKNPIDRKRRCFACLLLLAFCLQRVIGFLGGEIVYVVLAESRMDGQEKRIAEKILAETGFDLHIEIQSDGQIKALQGLGYSSPFIFSEEIEGQLSYYTLNESPVKALSYTFTTEEQQKPEAPADTNRAIKDRLFSDFYFLEPCFWLKELPGFHSRLTAILPSWENSFLSITSPPPELA